MFGFGCLAEAKLPSRNFWPGVSSHSRPNLADILLHVLLRCKCLAQVLLAT